MTAHPLFSYYYIFIWSFLGRYVSVSLTLTFVVFNLGSIHWWNSFLNLKEVLHTSVFADRSWLFLRVHALLYSFSDFLLGEHHLFTTPSRFFNILMERKLCFFLNHAKLNKILNIKFFPMRKYCEEIAELSK